MPRKTTTAKRFSEETIAEAERKRSQHRVVRRYLDALEQQSRNGHRADPAKLQEKIDQIDKDLIEASGVKRLQLTQRRLDLQLELTAATGDGMVDDFEELESAFIEVAAEWAERQGITYTAMRSIGIPARVLSAAEVPRTRLPNGLS